jgi:hypothetical protein
MVISDRQIFAAQLSDIDNSGACKNRSWQSFACQTPLDVVHKIPRGSRGGCDDEDCHGKPEND